MNPDACTINYIENQADKGEFDSFRKLTAKGIVFPGFVENEVPEESQTLLDNFEHHGSQENIEL